LTSRLIINVKESQGVYLEKFWKIRKWLNKSFNAHLKSYNFLLQSSLTVSFSFTFQAQALSAACRTWQSSAISTRSVSTGIFKFGTVGTRYTYPLFFTTTNSHSHHAVRYKIILTLILEVLKSRWQIDFWTESFWVPHSSSSCKCFI